MSTNKTVSAKDLPQSLTKDLKVISSMKAIQRAGFWAFIVAILTPFAFILSSVGGGAYPTPEKTYLYLAFIVYLAIIGLRLNQLKGPIVAILIINIILGLGFLGGIFPLLLVIMSIIALVKSGPYYKWLRVDNRAKS